MRERDDVHVHPVELRLRRPSDHGRDGLPVAEHLLDRESADGDDEPRREDLHLAREEAAPLRALLLARDAVAAALRLAGKAAHHRSDVDARADGLLVGAGRALEPAEERLPRRPRERTPEARLVRTGCLAHEEDPRRHGGPVHGRAEAARLERLDLAVHRLERGDHVRGRAAAAQRHGSSRTEWIQPSERGTLEGTPWNPSSHAAAAPIAASTASR